MGTSTDLAQLVVGYLMKKPKNKKKRQRGINECMRQINECKRELECERDGESTIAPARNVDSSTLDCAGFDCSQQHVAVCKCCAALITSMLLLLLLLQLPLQQGCQSVSLGPGPSPLHCVAQTQNVVHFNGAACCDTFDNLRTLLQAATVLQAARQSDVLRGLSMAAVAAAAAAGDPRGEEH